MIYIFFYASVKSLTKRYGPRLLPRCILTFAIRLDTRGTFRKNGDLSLTSFFKATSLLLSLDRCSPHPLILYLIPSTTAKRISRTLSWLCALEVPPFWGTMPTLSPISQSAFDLDVFVHDNK